jgi:hypothetical protein
MKKYKVTAQHTVYLSAEVEAESSEQAWELAIALDGGDFEESGFGDWDVISVEERIEA